MDKRKFSGIGVGSTSIIMIFVVLCLTTFSILSLVTSNVAKKYTEKSIAFTTSDYEAQNEANQTLEKIDNILLNAQNDALNYDSNVMILSGIDGVKIISQPDGYIASYDIPITESRYLSIELKIPLYPSDVRFSIIKWAETPFEADYEGEPNKVWDGNFN